MWQIWLGKISRTCQLWVPGQYRITPKTPSVELLVGSHETWTAYGHRPTSSLLSLLRTAGAVSPKQRVYFHFCSFVPFSLVWPKFALQISTSLTPSPLTFQINFWYHFHVSRPILLQGKKNLEYV